MARFDREEKYVVFKIVFAGGSESAVRHCAYEVVQSVEGENPDESLKTPDGHSRLAFELSLPRTTNGWQTEIQAVTLPFGDFEAGRLLTLKDADAMIFIWDGTQADSSADLSMWKELKGHLERCGRSTEDFAVHPVIFNRGPGKSWTHDLPDMDPAPFYVDVAHDSDDADDADGTTGIMDAFKAATRSSLAVFSKWLAQNG
jgi:hypothetical protein